MKHISNEEKAKEIGRMWYYDNAQPNNAAYRGAVQMGIWKDKQFENAIKEIKANIIEKRDNKEYYETSKESTLNWILRLIDECCTKGE